MNLQQTYSRQDWQTWLSEIFGTQMQFETQAENVEINKENIKSIQRFASVKLADGKNLAVLDIETHAGVQIARNRVGLRDLVVKFIDHARYHGILAFYHSEDTTQNQYRLSFISSEPTIDADGNFSVQSTAPKRFTYVLGENEKTKTPTDRLKIITKTQGKATLKDIQDVFSVETLTKEFYTELFAWYQWALSEEIGVTFPNDRSTDKDDRQIEEHIIRLITRLMFVWFIKQKQLIPEDIFDIDKLKSILKDFDATNNKQDNYYRTILQNLFFATLNNRIEDRAFATDGTYLENKVQYGIKTLYRYADEFSISTDEVIELFNNVPFLNGGLFECLDKDSPDSNGRIIYYDGFSRKKDRQSRAHIPNILFFQKDKGLIPLLSKYNFTIEENSPSDIEVALDPELLGKVFENLLGTYNPETKETARNQSGSFYTPREIVNYMVDESLKAYLANCLNCDISGLSDLFNDTNQSNTKYGSDVYKALLNVKILDPACGSGAFPMGALNRILTIIEKLPLPKSISIYELKLHLIENCIYGIDIQSIAVQISKLRFFISLICEQTPDKEADNFGIKPLPNLETKFVAANTLIGLNKKKAGEFIGNLFEDPQIEVTKKSLLEIRHLHFSADTTKKKKEYRSRDKELREKLANLLELNNDFAPEEAKQVALWNPYDQNTHAKWFDMEWMFGLKEGFDIVLGNPPYVQLENNQGELSKLYKPCGYKFLAKQNKGDIYCLFYERGMDLLKKQGTLCYITSNKWMRAGYGEAIRDFFAKETNPKLLIDFAGVKVFESATVDTNILLLTKSANQKKTICAVTDKKSKDGVKNLSVFVQQTHTICEFSSSESWVILSPIEQSIKRKIEAVGIPLKDWDIQINYGIKTGFNDAFIIPTEKRDEILANCKTQEEREKTAELIRPILRGRDIKRYGYDWADLWLIATFPSRKYDIEKFPAVKQYLLSFGKERLMQSGSKDSRKKTNNKWFETQDSISYWEDFLKPKIIYPNMTKYLPFVYDQLGFVTNQKCFIITGKKIAYLNAFFNSSLFKYCFRDSFPELQGGTRELSKIFFDKIPILKISSSINENFERLVIDIQNEYTKKKAIAIDTMIFDLYELTEQERSTIGFIEIY